MRGVRRWEFPPSQGSPAPSVAPTLEDDGGHGDGDGSPSFSARSRKGGGARHARRLAGLKTPPPGGAARHPVGAWAAVE